MLTDERLKQLMQQVGMPNSTSLMQALLQCDMEATLAERERCAAIADSQVAELRGDSSREHLASFTTAQNIAGRIRAS